MRSTCLLAGILTSFLMVALAAPALAGDDRPAAPDKPGIEKEIKKLTKELKRLESQLEDLRAEKMVTDEHPKSRKLKAQMRVREKRLQDARQRLAVALAGRDRATKAIEGARRRAAAGGPTARGPRGRGRQAGPPTDAAPGHMTRLIGTLKKMHEADRKLAARVQTLEQQIRRLAAAIGRHEPGSRDEARPGPAPRGGDREGPPAGARRGRGPGGPGGPHGSKPGAHGGPPAEVLARLDRIEGLLARLVGARHDRMPPQRGMKRRAARGANRGAARGMKPGAARGMKRGAASGMRGWMRPDGRRESVGARGTGPARSRMLGMRSHGDPHARSRGAEPRARMARFFHGRGPGRAPARGHDRRGASGGSCPFCGCGGEG